MSEEEKNKLAEEMIGSDPMIEKLVRWGEEREDVRAMILTSSMASQKAALDPFSDYDVIVVVRDILPYLTDDSWLEDFGSVLVVYRDPVRVKHGYKCFARITQYDDTKIDFTIYPAGLMQVITAEARRLKRLEDDLDIGYRVLLDKDGLPAPTYTAYIPSPPSEAEYLEHIELFFHEATYAVKNFWRGELLPARYFTEEMLKQAHLLPMLEYKMEIDHGWSLKTGVLGKGIQKYLPPELLEELAHTYSGPGFDGIWEVFYRTVDLFRKVAIEVGEKLGYAYPYELDRRAMAYFRKVEALPKDAKKLE